MMLIGFLLASLAGAEDREDPAEVVLDGQTLSVRWSDGDTFSWTDAGGATQRARLDGYNTLESFGPAHRWGDWTTAGLYVLAKEAGKFAASRKWTCRKLEGSGGYGRLLVDCPDLRRAMVEAGFAHLYEIEEEPLPGDMLAQKEAMERKRGIWAEGVPELLVTSLHSKREGLDETYDRACSTTTAKCEVIRHEESYGTCQEVCHGGSCMVYVPYEERYGRTRARCLYVDEGAPLKVTRPPPTPATPPTPAPATPTPP